MTGQRICPNTCAYKASTLYSGNKVCSGSTSRRLVSFPACPGSSFPPGILVSLLHMHRLTVYCLVGNFSFLHPLVYTCMALHSARDVQAACPWLSHFGLSCQYVCCLPYSWPHGLTCWFKGLLHSFATRIAADIDSAARFGVFSHFSSKFGELHLLVCGFSCPNGADASSVLGRPDTRATDACFSSLKFSSFLQINLPYFQFLVYGQWNSKVLEWLFITIWSAFVVTFVGRFGWAPPLVILKVSCSLITFLSFFLTLVVLNLCPHEPM